MSSCIKIFKLLIFFIILLSKISTHILQEINICLHYEKPTSTDNSITGTGNRLKDIAYFSTCLMLNCADNCCEGEINAMTCAEKVSCLSYKSFGDKSNLIIKILSVTFTYLVIPILWIIKMYCKSKEKHSSHRIISKILFVYICAVLPPYGIYLLFEYLFCPRNNSWVAEEFTHKRNENVKLFHMKVFQQQDFV